MGQAFLGRGALFAQLKAIRDDLTLVCRDDPVPEIDESGMSVGRRREEKPPRCGKGGWPSVGSVPGARTGRGE